MEDSEADNTSLAGHELEHRGLAKRSTLTLGRVMDGKGRCL
jgi:hypothetical protein